MPKKRYVVIRNNDWREDSRYVMLVERHDNPHGEGIKLAVLRLETKT
jgi:hypothetical protein